MDSDSIREKIGLRGIETQFHSPELLPPNPTSFQAEQKPRSQRHNFGCQGNLTPAQLRAFQTPLSPEQAQMSRGGERMLPAWSPNTQHLTLLGS